MLRRIADATGETAYASGWWNGEIVTLVSVRGHNAVQASEVSHGTYSDAHARASGKLLLAYATEEQRTAYLSSHRLKARTAKTIATLPRLYEEFERIRAAGYATDLEEFANGLCCLAVGLGGDTPLFALTISAPAERFEREFETYLATMKQFAREL